MRTKLWAGVKAVVVLFISAALQHMAAAPARAHGAGDHGAGAHDAAAPAVPDRFHQSLGSDIIFPTLR